MNTKKQSIFNENNYVKLARALNQNIEKGSYLNQFYEAKSIISSFFNEPVVINRINPRKMSISVSINNYNLKNRILKSRMASVKLVLNFSIVIKDQKISFYFTNKELTFLYANYNFDRRNDMKSIKMGGFPISRFDLSMDFDFSNEKELIRKLNKFVEDKNVNKMLCENIKSNFGKFLFGGNELDGRFKRKFINNDEAFVDFLFENFNLIYRDEVFQ